MNNHKHRFPGALLWFVVFSVMSIAPFSLAQAASVAIDTLSVSSVSFNIQVTNDGTYNFSGPVSPPVYVTMGTYQDPIVGGTNWKIYSTSLFGKPAPTGSVDSALGTISVDFSSLRGQFMSTYGMLDFALPLVTNPPAGGTYNGATGVYSLNWSDPFSVSTTVILAGVPTPITLSGTASVTLGGTVTTVPLPAAVWLLGSGLLGIVAAVRRKRFV